jgi:hypothetical protein
VVWSNTIRLRHSDLNWRRDRSDDPVVAVTDP